MRYNEDGERARRLEFVREQRGFSTLKEFWEALTDEQEYEVSYEAVRTYHGGSREPPAHYLARVADQFDVNGDWLLLGEGEPFVAGEQVRRDEEKLLRAAYYGSVDGVEQPDLADAVPRFVRHLPVALQQTFITTAALIARAAFTTEGDVDKPLAGSLELLGELVLSPLEQLSGEALEPVQGELPIRDPAFERYVEAMLLAVKLATALEREVGSEQGEE